MNKPNYTQELFKFALFPKFNSAIEFLAENLADPEEWEFTDATENKYSILKNYIFHIFKKLKEENKISYTAGNAHACFNTGLITKNLEEIFALFELYKDTRQRADNVPFCFKAFVKTSDIQLIKVFKGNHPDIANFFQKPEDLIFNPQCKIIPQIDHIIEDNRDRFPLHMKGLDDSEIQRRLDGAISEVIKKVKTNYKIAVPQYYNNKIQLLLPLCLTPGSTQPDLALVTHKISQDTYTARTCLTLKMAYNNARLIVKPQSSWLKP